MNTTKAYEIIDELSNHLGLSFFDTMVYMQNYFEDLWEDQKVAYRKVMVLGSKMFAPV